MKGTIILAFLLTVPLTAAVRTQEPQPQNAPVIVRGSPLTPEELAQLQNQLQANPDDLAVRGRLLMYYGQQGPRSEFVEQMLWIIQNHPESPLAVYVPAGRPLTAVDGLDQLKTAWEQALATHMDSSQVIFNAGRFFESADPQRAVRLFQSAREEESRPNFSALYLAQIARVYAEAIMVDLRAATQPKIPNLNPDTAALLRTQLQESTDAALLSRTGELLVQMNIPPLPEQKLAGLHLIQRAIELDPSNPEWKSTLESAEAERMPPKAFPTGAVRIGGKVAEANLIQKVEPVYPPLALLARVQGDVEFTVTVGTDGHVQSVTLVRGHPLLINAAKEAVLQWTYRPTLLNGQPVSVVYDLVVPFRLPQ